MLTINLFHYLTFQKFNYLDPLLDGSFNEGILK
jgi:hypothetical protein